MLEPIPLAVPKLVPALLSHRKAQRHRLPKPDPATLHRDGIERCDAREVERKKVGLRKARKKEQFSKR